MSLVGGVNTTEQMMFSDDSEEEEEFDFTLHNFKEDGPLPDPPLAKVQ